MSWSRRRALGIVAGLLASACGFTPVYGPGGPGGTLDGAVRLQTPQNVNGFTVRQRLQDRLGPPQSPRFTLQVQIQTSSERVGITRAQSTNRFNLLGVARYDLRSFPDNARVTRGEVSSFIGYGASGTPLATQAAERDAFRRLMVVLADGIVERLYLAVPATVTRAQARP